ncbi:MAG: hypothetical protein ACXWWV_11720, partial [Candidatus Deferrimicrobiaceae bacterium]
MGRFLSSGFNHFDESRVWNDSVRSGRDAVHDTGIFDDDQFFDDFDAEFVREQVIAAGTNPQKKHLLRQLVKKVLIHSRETVEIWYVLPKPQRFADCNIWLPKCTSMRTRPGWIEPEVWFRIVHAALDSHNGGPVAACREQAVKIALGPKGVF